MSEVPFQDGPWMPTVDSAEDQFLVSQEDDPMDLLTEKQRFVIELRYGIRDGISYTQREVAALMGITKRAVAKHEEAAKKKLERVLKPGTQKALE